MLNIYKGLTIFLIFSLGCINLSQAQDANAALNQALGSVQPANPTTTPAPNTGTSALTPSIDNKAIVPATPTLKKYEEFQSICRKNTFDLIKDYPEDLKKKRVDLLKSKIDASSSEAAIKFELRLFKEYIDQNKKDNYAEVIKSLKSKKLSDSNNQFLNALILISENNLTAAAEMLTKLVLEEKENQEALKLLAEIYVAKENYYEASTIYEDLNRLTNNAYLVERCEVTVLDTMNVEGEKLCLQAANKFPKNPFPYIYIGISYRERLSAKTAIDYFNKSIKIRSTEMAQTCLGEALTIVSSNTKAADAYKKSLTINPSSTRALLALAWTELKLKRYDDSLKTFSQACKINSKYETELRKAYKNLSDEKIPEAIKFIKLADACGN